jgi:excisionase family DNA binding protein
MVTGMPKPTQVDIGRLLSVRDSAEYLGCSRGHVYGLIASGRIKCSDIGTGRRALTRIRLTELDAFISKGER